jgi:hypothetical protein
MRRWRVNQQGWRFMVTVSAPHLLLAGLRILEASTFQAMLPAILPNGTVLICSLVPGGEDALGGGSAIASHR